MILVFVIWVIITMICIILAAIESIFWVILLAVLATIIYVVTYPWRMLRAAKKSKNLRKDYDDLLKRK